MGISINSSCVAVTKENEKKKKKKTQKENYDLPFQNFQSNFQPEENGNLPSRW